MAVGYARLKSSSRRVFELAATQHGVVTRAQMRELGLASWVIHHRIAVKRLHPVFRGVYAVGRPELTQYGGWMAAVLACGPDAALSHASAAALWEIGTEGRLIEVSVSLPSVRRHPRLVAHRRSALSAGDVTTHHGIPVTTPICTLIDIAPRLSPGRLEVAINEADKLGLTNPEELGSALDAFAGRNGVAALRRVLDRQTFAFTDSELERRFLPIVRKAGLPLPQTQTRVNGFKVDFYWPDLGLVVETDGLRYHRTPAQQARDRVRDQAHAAGGLTCLRFTHAQIRYGTEHVRATLVLVVRRLGIDT